MRLMSRFAALVATGMLLMFLLMQQLDPSGLGAPKVTRLMHLASPCTISYSH